MSLPIVCFGLFFSSGSGQLQVYMHSRIGAYFVNDFGA